MSCNFKHYNVCHAVAGADDARIDGNNVDVALSSVESSQEQLNGELWIALQQKDCERVAHLINKNVDLNATEVYKVQMINERGIEQCLTMVCIVYNCFIV